MSEQNPPQPPGGNQPPNYDPPPPPYGAPVPLDDAQTRQWAGLAHLGGILFFLPSLIIWLVYRERSAFVGQEAKKALNFQITVALGYVACTILAIAGVPLTGLLQLAVWIVAIVFSVQGYQAVQRGQAYKYPFSLELIK
ncbi:DUF4870 domain-containing protein [Pengzhenrongella sp.]|jgi:uncharacterized Tic20 family protein|uniref:DUF4870 domain-containing protein n=1 Tax=Pengzhenrongella sp. TaxID=2888820 RepID=UPI002F93C4DA